MFAIDKRKFEVRDRIVRNNWVDFDLTDFGFFTLIYEMDEGESLMIIDDRDRHMTVMKNEDGELTITHEDFVMRRAYFEAINKTAFFRNGHVSVSFSLTGSKVIDFMRMEDE